MIEKKNPKIVKLSETKREIYAHELHAIHNQIVIDKKETNERFVYWYFDNPLLDRKGAIRKKIDSRFNVYFL